MAGADARVEQLKQEALRHEREARANAERGEIEAAAQAILAQLNCERRVASSGPQVLQVIKPRH